jgi:long-chain fatty acid transport protein
MGMTASAARGGIRSHLRRGGALGTLIAILATSPAEATNGHLLHAAGAIDSAMGGSGIAEPQDVIAPLFHNVGGLARIPGTRIDLNLELIRSRRHVRSSLGGQSGRTQSDSDLGLIPAFGVSHTPEGSDLTFFVGALGISGFGADYPESDSNPVLRPQVEGGVNTGGFGRVFSFYQLLRMTGGVAAKLGPDLSIGIAPTVNYATLELEPFPAAAPDCTAGGVCAYPRTNQAAAIGGGFLLGAHYQWSEQVSLGLGYTSPQWFTEFAWNSSVANPEREDFGRHRKVRFRLDAPQSVGFGIAWKPAETLLLTTSAKWIDFGGTRGLDEEGFDENGRVEGLGWDSTWTAGVGGQIRPLPWLTLRAGYNFTESPVDDRLSAFNVASPVVIQHHATGGLGVAIGEAIELNLAYYHAFANTLDGPFIAPGLGAVPNSSISSTLAEDSILLQLGLKM